MSDPVIAELSRKVPAGRSARALFLDGDSSNTDPDNVIDQEYFDNCYSFEEYLDDYQHRLELLERVAVLEQALAKCGAATP